MAYASAMSREAVIATLRAYEPELRAAGIVRLSLFGSTERGEACPGSDIDLRATFDQAFLPPGDTRAYPYFMGSVVNQNYEPEKPLDLKALILVHHC